jgi:DNA polymerase-3 subunit epsilon
MSLLGRWRKPAPDRRCVVVDTETAGLDPARDALLAIGAVAVDDAGVRIADSFEVTVRSDTHLAHDNVLVHGLGRDVVRSGVPAAAALAAFDAYVAGAPCIGFHCEFDRAVLARAAAGAGVVPGLRAPWLDVAELARALEPDRYRKGARSLDDWLSAFAVATTTRHTAAGDALATAELLLKLRAVAARRGDRGFDALLRLARHRRWLGG